MAKTGKLLRSLFRAGTRTVKLFADATKAATPKPKRRPATKRAIKPTAKLAANTRAKPGAQVATKLAAKPAPKPAPKPASKSVAKPARSRALSAAPRVPAPAIAPGKWLSAFVTDITGRRMSYWLYLPDTPADSKGWPLLVMLHGCSQTATQFAQGTRMNLWAEKKGYAVLYPQQSISNHPHRCWKWYDRAGGEAATIVSMINTILTQYPIDRARIYAAGISAGAGMANMLALNHPRLIAAVGLHSGPVHGAGHNTLSALSVMKNGAPGQHADIAAQDILQRDPHFPGMPAILFQGESDNIVRPINQHQLTRQSLLLNRLSGPAKITHKPRTRGKGFRQHDFYAGRKPALRVVQVDQLDHAWSGGDSALSFNDHTGPDASRMMLEFFSHHRRT